MSIQLRELARGFQFVECPRWHDGRFWFVDFFSRQVMTTDLAGKVTILATVPNVPGGLGFMPDGRVIVVSQRDFRLLEISDDGSLTGFADLSSYARGAANDLLVDDHGRAYVGHHGYDAFSGAEPQAASLLLVQADGSVSEVADNLVFPNGMALADGGRTLIVAETFAHRLTAFDVGDSGTLFNRRVWALMPDRAPDGICMDLEGAIWAGCPFAQEFVRVEEGGRVTHRIATPGRWAVACALGGARSSTLLCTTDETSMENMVAGKSAGFIELADIR